MYAPFNHSFDALHVPEPHPIAGTPPHIPTYPLGGIDQSYLNRPYPESYVTSSVYPNDVAYLQSELGRVHGPVPDSTSMAFHSDVFPRGFQSGMATEAFTPVAPPSLPATGYPSEGAWQELHKAQDRLDSSWQALRNQEAAGRHVSGADFGPLARSGGVIESTFYKPDGRRCYVVCEPPRRPPRPDRPASVDRIARRIVGMPLGQAMQMYPNIRVVIRNGKSLPTTQDYRKDRINVETNNGIITRVVGFY